MSVLLKHPDAWNKLWRKLGTTTAKPLGIMNRDDAIKALRFDFSWTLDDIGQVFDITKERVRQIVPDKHKAAKRNPYASMNEIDHWLTVACQDKKAWTQKGRLSKRWLNKQLAPLRVGIDMNDDIMCKFQILLRCGLRLKTAEEQRAQMHEWQFGVNYYSYTDIARILSRRFVTISVMAVFRGAESIGHKGHSTGAPGQPRRFVESNNVVTVK